MEKLILNTEILSKMKVDLNKIYIGFDKVNEDILKIEEIVSKVLECNIVEEDICNMYRILTDIEMYIFLKEDIENVSKEEIYNNVKIDIIEKYMYDFYVYIESIKKDFKENTFIYNFVRSSTYYFYGYKYYIRMKDISSQTNLKLERARIKLLKYIEKLEKDNKDYEYNEDKEKLYFKLFKSWVKYVRSKKEDYDENIISNVEYIFENVEVFRNEYIKYYENYMVKKNYGDYNYTKIINNIFKNLLEDERLEHYEIIEDMFEKRKISCGVKSIKNSKCYVGEVKDTIYMNLAFDENKYNNMRMFFHELRTLY